jgi:hypothetical protein
MKLIFWLYVIVVLYFPAHALAQPAPPIDTAELTTIIERGLLRVYGSTIPKLGDHGISFTIKKTRTGDTASGVEVARTNDILSIDATPCAAQKTIVTFVRPYNETPISDVRCGSNVYSRLQVIQE